MAAWAQIAAAVAPSIIGGMFGGGKSQKVSQEAIDAAKQASQQGYFRPVTVTSSMGGAGVGPYGNLVSQMTPQYQNIVNQSLAGAGNMYGQLAGFDPSARAAEIYKEQAALLQPSFEQQATDLQSRLFGSGRLGLRLAGESQGLGTGSGMVQPDALGLGQAQQQTLAQVAAGSRAQAYEEANQTANLAGAMLKSGLSIQQAETEMMKLGVDAETARAAAAYAAGSLMMSPYTGAMQAAAGYDQNRAGLFGGITTGLLSNPNFMGGSGATTATTTTTARPNPVGGYGFGYGVGG
jgi:hypothetical protein